MSIQTSIPLPQMPLSGPDGQINEVWWRFFLELWNRTGAGPGITDAEANGLTRKNSSSTSSNGNNEIAMRRSALSNNVNEVIPSRNSKDRLFVTKETYAAGTLIRLYTGLVANIPKGWQLADGTNGTPNLSDRFIVGSGNLYPLGSAAGSTTITVNNLPAHTHPYNDLNTTYTANTVAVQSGTGTTVVQSITGSSVDTSRTTGNNTTTAQPFVPPYYAVSYIINTSAVTVVTDVKLR